MDAQTAPEPPEPRQFSYGELSDLAGYHLRRTSAAFGSDFARVLEGTGMRQVLFGILAIIAANPGVGQGAVGNALGVQRANMVALTNELVERGLVDRAVSATDRRAFALTLTDEGRALVETSLRRIRAHEDRMLANLSAQERATLIKLLRRVAIPA